MSYKGISRLYRFISYCAQVYDAHVANVGSAPPPGVDVLVTDGMDFIVTDSSDFIEVV